MVFNNEKKRKFIKVTSLIVLIISAVIAFILCSILVSFSPTFIQAIPEFIKNIAHPDIQGLNTVLSLLGIILVGFMLLILVIPILVCITVIVVCYLIFKKHK